MKKGLLILSSIIQICLSSKIFSDVPQHFLVPGIVAILSHGCHHSTELQNFLFTNKIPYKPIYLEDDNQALNFVTKRFAGRIPWVYENGKLIGDGKQFMSRYPHLLTDKTQTNKVGLIDKELTTHNFVKTNEVLISYFSDEQGLKTLDLMKQDYLQVHEAFSNTKVEDKNIVRECLSYEIFKIKQNDELIASVFFRKCKYFTKISTLFSTYIKEEDGIEIYSLYVSDKYKGMGFARKLLYVALQQMKDHYNLKNNYIIGLHLNEKDKFMNISFALYYAMNFNKATFVESGPFDYAPKFQEYYKFYDPIGIVKNPSICADKNCFFAMFTRFCDILPFNPIRSKETKEIGEQLRKILQTRKKTI